MQKTIKIDGKIYNAKKIIKLFNPDLMTNGEDYIVNIGNRKFFANFRQIQDEYYAPVCSRENANAITLENAYSFEPKIWLSL